MHRSPCLPLSVLLPLFLAACANPNTSPAPRVFFTSPANGATVSSPVHVALGAESFKVEPAGAVTVGAGHLHIMVDTACVAPGQVITKDAQHLHYGTGQMEADLELAPGSHTLCLQAADGAHTALSGDGLTQTINITVQ
jgi:uncharacterized protein (DUF2345 family)